MAENKFTSTLKLLTDVSKAHKAGEISKDQGYAILETAGLHKGPSTVEKLGKALAIGVGAVATGGALGAFAGGASGISAGASLTTASKLLKSPTQPVSLIDNLTQGINKVTSFAQTEFGSQLIGTMGKMVQNLATPAQGKPSTAAQKIALAVGNISNVKETLSQAAVFQGKGVSVEIGEGGETWWSRNKSWALPVVLAVPGFFVLLFALFGRRRRR